MAKLDRSLYLEMQAEERKNKASRRNTIGSFAKSNPKEAQKIFKSLFR
jgi:hypothetical protein